MFKYFRNLLILIFIILVIICYYNIHKYDITHKNIDLNLNSNKEGFMTPGEVESATGNIEKTDGTCNKPNNPEYVAKNYSVCCNEQTDNCICKFNSLQKCATDYDECFTKKSENFEKERERKINNLEKLKEDVQELEKEKEKTKSPLLLKPILDKIKSKKEIIKITQEEIEEEPAIPPGLKQQCQTEFGKCVKNNVSSISNNKYNEKQFKIVPMKTNKDGEKICSIKLKNEKEIAKCINYCDSISNCKGGIYNKTTGICELFDKQLVDKDPGYKNGDGGYIAFIRNNSNNSNNKEGFVNNSNNEKKVMVNNKLKEIEKKSKGSKSCKSTYNDNLEQLQERHTFKKLNLPSDIEPSYDSEICKLSDNNITLSRCKNSCLLNDKCDYLLFGNNSYVDNSNNNLNSNLNNNKYIKPNNTCKLYSGVPDLKGETISLSKIESGKGYNYYIKKIIPIDDRY